MCNTSRLLLPQRGKEMSEDPTERVRKLLAKADDEGCTKEEADSLIAKAAAMMAKYGIDKAVLAAKEEVKELPTDKVMEVDNPYGAAKAHLLTAVAKAFNVHPILLNKRPGFSRVHLFGFAQDIRATEIIFLSVLMQGMTESLKIPAGENKRSWQASFWHAFAWEVGERLKASTAKVKKESAPGTSVVLAAREKEVDAAVKVKYPRLVSIRYSASSTNGYNAGRTAGQNANLHMNKSTSNSGSHSLTSG